MDIRSLFSQLKEAKISGQDWAPVLTFCLGVGFVAVAIYGNKGGVTALVAGLVLGLACLFIGFLLGFLFGIPRSLQGPAGAPRSAIDDPNFGNDRYAANTNLEQISDWLTKILVGVGLTQLTTLPARLLGFGTYFGPLLGPGDNQGVAVAAALFFGIGGFLSGYIWTRLYLGREFFLADSYTATDLAKATEEQGQVDATALNLVAQLLTAQDVSKISVGDLKQSVANASPPVKVQIFYQARDARHKSWNVPDQRFRVERTIPIFEALCESDKENRFHANHGQLGYALKDQRNPDYSAAARELSDAITIRGPARSQGYELYEFNRAICYIMLDPNFQRGEPSLPDSRARILDDLEVSKEKLPDMDEGSFLVCWLRINNIADLSNVDAVDSN